MTRFSYFQPTEILFGGGRLDEVGEVTRRFGRRCLLVTGKQDGPRSELYARIGNRLKERGVEVEHFDGVRPNPTTDLISEGAARAAAAGVEVVLGVGGGSAMDAAKAIAVEAVHEGTAWDYLWFSEKQPGERTLPVVTVSTTSGTGSQVTQVAVLTNPKTRDKSAIYNSSIYPKVALVDPQLMTTVPGPVTAATGFDVFCHAFESYLHPAVSPYIEMLALEALRIVARDLPVVVTDGNNLRSRSAMAWADTLAGLCIANAGVTLPHGVAMAMGGLYPSIAHGEALAVIYPAFTRFTWESGVERFAAVARILNPDLADVPDEAAAERACMEIDALLKRIGLWRNLCDFEVAEDELQALARQSLVLPDYKNNPRVATPEQMSSLIHQCYRQ